jgi:hypothetical protein
MRVYKSRTDDRHILAQQFFPGTESAVALTNFLNGCSVNSWGFSFLLEDSCLWASEVGGEGVFRCRPDDYVVCDIHPNTLLAFPYPLNRNVFGNLFTPIGSVGKELVEIRIDRKGLIEPEIIPENINVKINDYRPSRHGATALLMDDDGVPYTPILLGG